MKHREIKPRSVLSISLATLLSRILGVVRVQLFAFLFGATDFADSFIVAYRIPNLLRDLFAEGVFSTAFVPVFTEYLINKSKKESFKLASYTLNLLFLIIGTLLLIGYFFTPEIVKTIAPGFTGVKFNITVSMTRILLPFLLFVSFATVFMGMLNSFNKFFIPAVAPATFNFIIILTGLIIIFFKIKPLQAIIVWAIGALMGGLAQLLIQVPFAIKEGFKYSPQIKINEGVKKIFKLILPATVGLAAVQLNVIINTNLASRLPEGSISYLNYAFRLFQFPIGVFGVAIATVNLAMVSKNVAENDINTLKKNIASALKMNAFLTFPSIIGFITLGKDIIKLIFEHGEFTAIDTLNTYHVLMFLSIGLFFYAGVKIIAPVFYALNRSRISVIGSIMAVAVNITISLLTYKKLGVRGLALGLALGSVVNFSFLIFQFTRRYGKLKGENLPISFFKNIISSLLMGLLIYFMNDLFSNLAFILKFLSVFISGTVFYLLFSYFIGVKEVKLIKERLFKMIRK